MKTPNLEPIPFKQYEADTRELADTASNIIQRLRSEMRSHEVMMWAMVRAAGGSLLVRDRDIGAGMPTRWKIEDTPSEGGRRFTIIP